MNLRLIAIFTCLILCNVKAYPGRAQRDQFGEIRTITLPYNAILNDHSIPLAASNGKVGFVSSVMTGSLISFSLKSGKVLSSVMSGELAGIPAMVESNNRRVIALPIASGATASVDIIDATDEQRLEKVASISLPSDAQVIPYTRALLTGDGLFGVIASSSDKPTLYSLNIKSGEVTSKLLLPGRPSEIALHDNGFGRRVAIVSEEANNLTLANLDNHGGLSLSGTFSPEGARFEAANNPVFGQDGKVIYVAASVGDKLFAVDAAKATLRGSASLLSPRRITVAQDRGGADLIAVTRIGNPPLAKSDGVTILTNRKEELTIKSDFKPPDVIRLSPANNVVFSPDSSTAYIGSKNGILFAFDTRTGELNSYKVVGNELRSLALNRKGLSLLTVRTSMTVDEIVTIYLGEENNNRLERQASAKSMPEIRQVSGEPIQVRLTIQGTNLQKGVIVEFVKAGNVIVRHTPERITEGQLTLSMPVKRLEALGSFELRVVTADNVVSNVIQVEPTNLISSKSLYSAAQKRVEIETASASLEAPVEPSPGPATCLRFVRQEVSNGELRVYVGTDGFVKFRDFTLDKPHRIVLDLQDVRNTFGNRIIPVTEGLIQRIRVGQPTPGVVRVVLDSRKNAPYRIIREENLLIITVGDQ
jgi:outer membrane protein assembly factor BamB